jgi:hypothetical protein
LARTLQGLRAFFFVPARWGRVDSSSSYKTGRNAAPKDETLVIDQTDKIDIARILIERVDGVVAQARVSTLALANAVLERWAKDAPEKGEGRCQIQIIFEDGFKYQSDIGITRSQKRVSLAKLLRQQLVALATPPDGRRRKSRIGITISPPQLALPLSADVMLARYDI